MADLQAPKKLRDPTNPYTMYNNQDRLLNVYMRHNALGGFQTLFNKLGVLQPGSFDSSKFKYDAASAIITQTNWAMTAISGIGVAINQAGNFGGKDEFKRQQAEVAIARQVISAGIETVLLAENAFRWAPVMNPAKRAEYAGEDQAAWDNYVADVKTRRNQIGATASFLFAASAAVGLGFNIKALQIVLDKEKPSSLDIAGAGLGVVSSAASVALNTFKGLATVGAIKNWSQATQNKLNVAGTAVGVVQMGASIGQLIPAMMKDGLTDEQRAVLGAEMGVQILGGVTQIVSNALLAYRAAQGLTLAGPALGMAAGALVLALSPLQIYGLVQQSGYADKLDDLGREMSQYGYSGDSVLADFYRDKTALEGGLMAATTTLALVGSAFSIAAACTVVGAPLAVVVGLATAIVSGILSGVQQLMIEDIARKYAEKIEEAGGPAIYFGKSMDAAYQKFISSPELVQYVKDLQEDMGVESVIGVSSVKISNTSLQLASMTKNSDKIVTEAAYISRFVDGAVQADQTLKIDATSGTMNVGGAEGKSQLLTFLTPLMAPGEEKRKTISTGKNSSSTSLELVLAEGGWQINEGDADSMMDVRNVVTRVVDASNQVKGEVAFHVDSGKGDDRILMGVAATDFDGGAGVNSVSYAAMGGRIGAGSIIVTPTATGFRVEKTLEDANVYQDIVKSTTSSTGKSTEDIQYRDVSVITADVAVVDTLANVANITGSSGSDRITGNAQDNVLVGGAGSDTLSGGAGDDRFVQTNLERPVYDAGTSNDRNAIDYKTAMDTIDGGEGSDTLDYSGTSTSVASLDATTSPAGTAVTGIKASIADGTASYRYVYAPATSTAAELNAVRTDRFSNIENLYGGERNDWLTGDAKDNALLGNGGNDALIGDGGNDYLAGGAGNDSLDAGTGDDVLLAGSGVDTLSGGSGNDSMVAGSIAPSTSALKGRYVMFWRPELGDGSRSTLQYGWDANGQRVLDMSKYVLPLSDLKILDEDGNNLAIGKKITYVNTLSRPGSWGMIDLGAFYDLSAVSFNCNDTVDPSIIGSVAVLLLAEDPLATGSSSGHGPTFDELKSKPGSMLYTSGTLAKGSQLWMAQYDPGSQLDQINGGDGVDTLDYSQSSAGARSMLGRGVAVDLNTGKANSWYIGASTPPTGLSENVANVENVGGTDSADYLLGNAVANILQGNGGNDTLIGGAGNDTLQAGAGNDSIDAGDGNDLLYAGDGADTVGAGAGDDYLVVLDYTPGVGKATYDGGSGENVLDYSASSVIDRTLKDRGVKVDLVAGTVDDWYAAGQPATVTANISNFHEVRGTVFNDVLAGDGNENVLDGGAGRDELDGAGGNDVLVGGEGADTVRGGAGDDQLVQHIEGVADMLDGGAGVNTLDYSASILDATDRGKLNKAAGGTDAPDSTGVTIDLPAGTVKKVFGTAGTWTDQISNVTNVVGSSLNDVIVADGQDNVVDGGGGNDSIAGGAGNDYLGAGSGADTLRGGTGNDLLAAGDMSAGTALRGRYVAVWRPLTSGTVTPLSVASVKVFDQSGADIAAGKGFISSTSTAMVIDLGEVMDISAINLLGKDSSSLNRNVMMAVSDSNPLTKGLLALQGDAAAKRYYSASDDRKLQVWSVAASLGGEADVFDGGDGVDTLDYSQTTMNRRIVESRGVNLDLGLGTADAWYLAGHTDGIVDAVANVENVIGSISNDKLTGNNNANDLNGDFGNDVVSGAGGNDTVSGGAGADTVSGGDGDDTLRAGGLSGATTLRGRYVMVMRSPTNNGSTTGDVLAQSELRIYDSSGMNLALGKTVQRSTGAWMMIDLGAETDLNAVTLAGLNGAALNQSVTIFVSSTNPSSSTHAALMADPAVTHYQSESDQRSVQNWVASINAAGEKDVYDGGAGNDVLDFSQSAELARLMEGRGVNLSLANGTLNSWYGAGHGADAIADTFSGIENVVGSIGNDILDGDANANGLEGNAGDDRINGADGDDTLAGGSGRDTLTGGAGGDLLVAGDSHSGKTALYGRYVMIWRPPAGNGNVAANILNLSELQVFDAHGVNVAQGKPVSHSANVAIYGGDGVMGKLVDGTVNTAGGNDLQRLQTQLSGNATVAPSDSWVMVDLGSAMDISAIKLFGNDLAVRNQNLAMFVTTDNPSSRTYASLSGDAGVARYLSETDGRAAQTWVSARNLGNEADQYDGGTGTDTLDYSESSVAARALEGRGVNVNLAGGTANQWYRAQHTDSVTDTVTGIDNVIGTLADDVLTGDGNANLLSGAGGNDSVSGGAGNDTMSGGYGADTVKGDDGDDMLVAGDTSSAGTALRGRYVMIWRPPANNGNVADNVLNLSELKVFDASGVNLAQGKAVSHSANVNIYGSDVQMKSLVDGAVNTAGANDYQRLQTHVTNNNSTTDTVIAPSNSWVMVDLGSVMDISSVILYGNDNTVLNQKLAMFVTRANPAQRTYSDLTADNTVARYLSEADGRAVQAWSAAVNLSSEADSYDGGAGLDTLDYSQSAVLQRALENRGVSVNLAGGSANQWYLAGHAADAVQDVLAGIENVTGTLQADSLTGDANGNVLNGSAGSDQLAGAGGADTYVFSSGDGADTITEAGADSDTVRFGAGVVPAAVTLELAGASNASLVIRYGNGDAVTVSNWASGADKRIERVEFGDGTVWDAAAIGSRIVRTVTGTEGNDSMVGTDYADSMSGLGGNDTISGGLANDTLLGGNGNDSLDGGAGEDSMAGGLGDDTYVVDFGSSTDAGWDRIVEEANAGNDTVVSMLSWTINNANLENLTIGKAGNFNATGNANGNVVKGFTDANTLSGLAGDDTIIGNGGNDTFIGGAGNDSLAGGVAADTYQYVLGDGSDVIVESGPSTVTDVLKFGTGITPANLVLTTSGNDLLISLTNSADRITVQGWVASDNAKIEQFVFADGTVWNAATIQSKLPQTLTGTSGADTLTATSSSTLMYGLDGNDKLTGGTGHDTLDGGAGNDTLAGGAGNDTYVVDSGLDAITENTGAGADTVVASLNWTITNLNLENLTLSGTSAINGTGNAGGNVLRGNSAGNTLTGYAGNDTLNGNDGNDSLLGGDGDDAGYGDNGNDTVFGGDGNDTLYGGAGGDVLGGGAGSDTVNGGAGNDTYQFNIGDGAEMVVDQDGTAGNSDVIQLMETANGTFVPIDQLWFSRAGSDLRIDVLGTTDSLTVSNWYGGAANHIEQVRIANSRYLTDTGVEALVQAMAGFSPPSGGVTSIPASYTAVQTALAANWN